MTFDPLSFCLGAVAAAVGSAVFLVLLHQWDLRQRRRRLLKRVVDSMDVSRRAPVEFVARDPATFLEPTWRS